MEAPGDGLPVIAEHVCIMFDHESVKETTIKTHCKTQSQTHSLLHNASTECLFFGCNIYKIGQKTPKSPGKFNQLILLWGVCCIGGFMLTSLFTSLLICVRVCAQKKTC